MTMISGRTRLIIVVLAVATALALAPRAAGAATHYAVAYPATEAA